MAPNTAIAKSTIKRYYRRVKEANAMFTGYKEGWKTDMGMIYIVFGPPDEVFKKSSQEVWRYTKLPGLPTVSFTFAQIDNIFVQQHYALVRNPNYKAAWIRKVSDWRRGR